MTNAERVEWLRKVVKKRSEEHMVPGYARWSDIEFLLDRVQKLEGLAIKAEELIISLDVCQETGQDLGDRKLWFEAKKEAGL